MPSNIRLLLGTLKDMKSTYENSIKEGTYTSLIRSKNLINLLHQYVIEELKTRVKPNWVVTDKKVYGFPKTKDQDIVIQPLQNGTNTDRTILSFGI